jgi:hypothetical protein
MGIQSILHVVAELYETKFLRGLMHHDTAPNSIHMHSHNNA